MSLPRRSTRNGTRGYAHLVEVKVPVARVWRALTDPALVRIWSGLDAEIDPREGGLYRLGKRQSGGREAHIDIFDANRRLRLIYLHTPDLPPSESAVVDDFLLDARKSDGVTSLRLLGSGVPEAAELGFAVREDASGMGAMPGAHQGRAREPSEAQAGAGARSAQGSTAAGTGLLAVDRSGLHFSNPVA